MNSLSAQSFNEQDENNMIYYQLETDKILERIKHFIQGDQIKFSEEGSFFAPPTKKILVNIHEDPKTKMRYYIQEIKESKKGTEFLKEVLIKIKNSDGEDIIVNYEDNILIMNKFKKIKTVNISYDYIEIEDEDKKPGLFGNLIGGFIVILVGTSMLNQMKKNGQTS